MTPTIERRDDGWYVRNMPNGKGQVVTVGPFTTAGNAAWFIAKYSFGF